MSKVIPIKCVPTYPLLITDGNTYIHKRLKQTKTNNKNNNKMNMESTIAGSMYAIS